ncbi:glycosyltransferase [Paenibacillus sp. BR2-3]|uniref:glycosyltransferase n=1 Tax=Paenibacillus sp. BR2-3 TaxID=3048494 RepID=UPI00397758B4
MTDLVKGILERNQYKNSFLRQTCLLSALEVENASVSPQGEFIPEKGKSVFINFKLQTGKKYYKIVYNILSPMNDGNVILHVKGNDQKYEKYHLGAFYGNPIVYFLKCVFEVKVITLEIVSPVSFGLSQLELIQISNSEYKVNKLKQYSGKLKRIVSKQPHLRAKFFKELKENGLKEALQKTKSKLYQNTDSYNSIQVSGAVLNTETSLKYNNTILFVSHDAQNAGASILSLNIVKSLKEVFNKDVIVLFLKGGPLINDFSKYATIINLNQNSLSYLENESEVNKIIKDFKNKGINTCISNSIVSNILTKTMFEHGIKVTSLVHELPTSINTYNFIEAAKYAAQYSEKIVFPNFFVRDSFAKAFSIEDRKVHVRPQGIYNKRKSLLNKETAKRKLCETLDIEQSSIILLGGGYGDIRKGFDIFFSIAKDILLEDNKKHYHFVWVGQVEPILEKWMKHDAQILNIDSNIHQIDFQVNLSPVLQGADLFLLPSREDPFPSIVLEAIDNGTPTVCFENSGGMGEFIKRLGVIPASYLNIKEIVSEICRLLDDEGLYQNIQQKGHELIDQELNFSDYVNHLLYLTRVEDMQHKEVSVIIPNYNYEDYIEDRLNSIIYQTVKPKEIIFLDDMSTDNSVSVAEEILKRSRIPYKIIKNKVNVGCFGQWIRGIKEATGDIVWIAEADDLCEGNMLEKLLPSFNIDEVNLAYCQSEIIDAESNRIGYVYTEYTKDLSETKWNSSYCIEGREEVVQGLAIKNTIPNASAVLFRASVFEGIEEHLSRYKIGGDWLAYLYALKTGKISYISETLNYHRRHSSSIVSKNEQKIELFQEMIAIKQFILDHFEIPNSILERFLEHVPNEYKRLGCKGYDSRDILKNDLLVKEYVSLVERAKGKVRAVNYLQTKKKIIFVAPDFEVGGGQMLVVRLANFFSAFHQVYVYNARPWLKDSVMTEMISANVTVLHSNGSSDELRSYIDDLSIEVINSHIWWSDKITFQAIQGNGNINWVLAMHGCYEALIENLDWDKDFESLVKPVLDRANSIIYATNKNRKVFDKVVINDIEKLHKVYYGYQLQNIAPKNKSDLGIAIDELIFGLVSRAIKEKGWEESIKAIINLNKELDKRAHLILVGNGEYANRMKEKYKSYDFVHFIMNLEKPSEWIGWVKVFDIAILPSYFISESLPNSIIEYLAYDKPVISTNIGEIPQMLYSEEYGKFAGIIMDLNVDGEVSVLELCDAMRVMATDPQRYADYKKNTKLLFEQFTMEKFASSYFDLF